LKSPIRQFPEGAQQDGFNYTFKAVEISVNKLVNRD